MCENIQSIISKVTGIVRKILTILDGIPIGKRYFEVGILLRDRLLIISEAWYNLSSSELKQLTYQY